MNLAEQVYQAIRPLPEPMMVQVIFDFAPMRIFYANHQP